MEIEQLLAGMDACECGKSHSCDIKYVKIKAGAVRELPELCKEYQHILLVADKNTYAVCGEAVAQILGEKIADTVIFTPDGLLIPNEESIDRIDAAVCKETDLIMGVGSGVINDLCKYVSFKNQLPYYIVATAPSMDGYASVGAALIIDNMKTTLNAHIPAAIIGDVEVLKNAPLRMLQSGFGDIIGKYSALNDWKLAHCINDEYFCRFIYDLTYQCIARTEALADGIQKREEQAIQNLMEALVIVGIAMSYTGNSRPASGSEHHLSHYFEITGIVFGRDYFFHGIDVAYSTVCTQKMREEILRLSQLPTDLSPISRDAWEQDIRKYYGKVADGVMALQDRCGYYDAKYIERYRSKWDEITAILKEVPSADKIRTILESVGLDYSEFKEMYGEKLIQSATLYAKDLKDRYTFLWIYFMLFHKQAV